MSVSVIIPVFNPGQALGRCLQSVLAQTYGHLEIILINDGSTDGSDGICRDFAGADTRIKYISQNNTGVSAARNKGIDLSTGEYICFVDSDDYVEPHYVQSMLMAMQDSNADIVIQGLRQMHAGGAVSEQRFADGVYESPSLSARQFDNIFYYCGPYCKLFKTSFVRNKALRFPENMSYGEDAVFYYAYLENCNSIATLSYAGYNYTVANPNALSSKILQPDEFWLNQSHRRGAYVRLKQTFGLEPGLSELEISCRLAGIKGMLRAIFKSGGKDADLAHYIDIMVNDKQFGLPLLSPPGVSGKILIALLKSNNTLGRKLLRTIYK